MAKRILDPTGQGNKVAEPQAKLSDRPRSLDGIRIGLLDNTKHNAGLFLKQIGQALEEKYSAKVSRFEVKHNFSVPVDEDTITRFKDDCNVVVTAIGDGGSCSAAAVADGITFEREGMPAAVVLTDAFEVTGRTMAKVHGDPQYTWVTTHHPVAVLSEEQVGQRAAEVLPEIVLHLTEGAV